MADIVKGWRWVAEPDACEFCQGMDGTEHGLDEDMDTHPNCRCTQEPIVVSEDVFTSFDEFRELFEGEPITIGGGETGLAPRVFRDRTELINRIWETDSFNVASQFRSGDIIAFLQGKWGVAGELQKIYLEATRLTMTEVNHLASIARRFTVPFRERIFSYLADNNLTLTFEHFTVVKSLNDVPAEYFLKRAADKHLTVEQLRKEVKLYKLNNK